MRPRIFYGTLFIGCLCSSLLSGFIVRHVEQAKHFAAMRELFDEPPPIILVGCELRRGEGETVELWHNGQLSEEIEARDGTTYRVLDEALRNELSYR